MPHCIARWLLRNGIALSLTDIRRSRSSIGHDPSSRLAVEFEVAELTSFRFGDRRAAEHGGSWENVFAALDVAAHFAQRFTVAVDQVPDLATRAAKIIARFHYSSIASVVVHHCPRS